MCSTSSPLLLKQMSDKASLKVSKCFSCACLRVRVLVLYIRALENALPGSAKANHLKNRDYDVPKIS